MILIERGSCVPLFFFEGTGQRVLLHNFSSGLLRNFLSTSLLIGMAQVILAVNITCTALCSTVESGTIYYCR